MLDTACIAKEVQDPVLSSVTWPAVDFPTPTQKKITRARRPELDLGKVAQTEAAAGVNELIWVRRAQKRLVFGHAMFDPPSPSPPQFGTPPGGLDPC